MKPGLTLYGRYDIFGIAATDQGAVPRTGTGTVTVCIGMICCNDGCCSGATVVSKKAIFHLIIVMDIFTLLYLEQPKLYEVLAVLSTIELIHHLS